MSNFSKIDAFLDKHLSESITELSVLTAQPSIAAQELGLTECAGLVSSMLQTRGFRVEIFSTGGAPIVFGERKGRTNKTLLFYNHYDVQPPEPLELWNSPPFKPTLREGRLYGRGVSDDKGHITSRLFAIDALLETEGELPCNIKFIIEGEEEVSSLHLHEFVKENKPLLAADACIWEFGGVDQNEIPIQYLGLRGICYVELSVETAAEDVHSGLGGSIFPNAAWRLTWALNSLKDRNEKICIAGFYDGIQPLTEQEMKLFAAMPDLSAEYKRQYGITGFIKGLQNGREINIAQVLEPTCTICGLTSGYQGPGSKTVLPARASAKVDFRLVPDQNPDDILKKLRVHLDSQGFADININYLGGESPARTSPDHPFVGIVVETARDVYGVPMQLVPLSGGSGPNYPFIHDLGLPVASAGLGYPDTRTHAPNENIRLDLYLKHAKHMARVLKEFSINP
ncbi:MAG: M20/M25/M40 family metallo-hydrolase [Anaerolineales bacterium]|nr:M20/M25/M40 family metallo-hydrolase [Anaerolineales bacterium]